MQKVQPIQLIKPYDTLSRDVHFSALQPWMKTFLLYNSNTFSAICKKLQAPDYYQGLNKPSSFHTLTYHSMTELMPNSRISSSTLYEPSSHIEPVRNVLAVS